MYSKKRFLLERNFRSRSAAIHINGARIASFSNKKEMLSDFTLVSNEIAVG
jgi:hypothetical protein